MDDQGTEVPRGLEPSTQTEIGAVHAGGRLDPAAVGRLRARRRLVDALELRHLFAFSRFAGVLRETPEYTGAQFARDQLAEGVNYPKTSGDLSKWTRKIDDAFGDLMFVTKLKEPGELPDAQTYLLTDVHDRIDAGKVTKRTEKLTLEGRNVAAIFQLLDILLDMTVQGTGPGLYRVLDELAAAFKADHGRYWAERESSAPGATDEEIEIAVFDSDFDEPPEHYEGKFDWTATTDRVKDEKPPVVSSP